MAKKLYFSKRDEYSKEIKKPKRELADEKSKLREIMKHIKERAKMNVSRGDGETQEAKLSSLLSEAKTRQEKFGRKPVPKTTEEIKYLERLSEKAKPPSVTQFEKEEERRKEREKKEEEDAKRAEEARKEARREAERSALRTNIERIRRAIEQLPASASEQKELLQRLILQLQVGEKEIKQEPEEEPEERLPPKTEQQTPKLMLDRLTDVSSSSAPGGKGLANDLNVLFNTEANRTTTDKNIRKIEIMSADDLEKQLDDAKDRFKTKKGTERFQAEIKKIIAEKRGGKRKRLPSIPGEAPPPTGSGLTLTREPKAISFKDFMKAKMKAGKKKAMKKKKSMS